MKIGAVLPNAAGRDPDYIRAFARMVEGSGLNSVWVLDHIVVPLDIKTPNPMQMSASTEDANAHFRTDPTYADALTTIGFIAACTETLVLATGVLVVPYRSPLILAKELATASVLSGGRFTAGIGSGWLAEEFEALGVPFNQRGRRTDEYIDVMKELWAVDGPVTHHGEFINFERVLFEPKPIGRSVPIVVGGFGDAALRRAGRIGDGWYGVGLDPGAIVEVRRRLNDLGVQFNRKDPIQVVSGGALPLSDADTSRAESLLSEFAAAGADEFVVYFSRGRSLEENFNRIRRLGNSIVPRLRAERRD